MGKKNEECIYYCIQVYQTYFEFDKLETVISDFEEAELYAIATVLLKDSPNAEIQGCFFHFSQANHRNFMKIYGKKNHKNYQKYEVAFKIFTFII